MNRLRRLSPAMAPPSGLTVGLTVRSPSLEYFHRMIQNQGLRLEDTPSPVAFAKRPLQLVGSQPVVPNFILKSPCNFFYSYLQFLRRFKIRI